MELLECFVYLAHSSLQVRLLPGLCLKHFVYFLLEIDGDHLFLLVVLLLLLLLGTLALLLLYRVA